MEQGQSIILGSIGRLDFDKGQPYMFTVFVSAQCSVHVAKTSKSEKLINKHAGELFKPVCDRKRHISDDRLKMVKNKTWKLEGIGWQSSVIDVVFPGIGWIAVTGCGEFTITAHNLPGVKSGIRRALMPREMFRSS